MSRRVVGLVFLSAFVGAPAVSVPVRAQTAGIREVSASARSLITLQTRLRYTTMIVLPEGEEILDVICGDKDFWVITSTQNIAHVKPAKEGAATNLNLVTGSGDVYSFLLTEKNGTSMPDLKVYVNADPSADWEFSRCEGAAGSSYCEWIGPDGALTFRVANEAAANGEDHAIAEVITTGG